MKGYGGRFSSCVLCTRMDCPESGWRRLVCRKCATNGLWPHKLNTPRTKSGPLQAGWDCGEKNEPFYDYRYLATVHGYGSTVHSQSVLKSNIEGFKKIENINAQTSNFLAVFFFFAALILSCMILSLCSEPASSVSSMVVMWLSCGFPCTVVLVLLAPCKNMKKK